MKVKSPIKRLIIITTIGLLALVASLHFLPASFEISDKIRVVGFYLTVVSILLVFFQLLINLNWNARKASIEFLLDQQWEKLKASHRSLNKKLELKYSYYDLSVSFQDRVESESDPINRKAIEGKAIEILNFYEIMSIAIKEGVLDDSICYDFFSGMALNFHDWTKSYMVKRREEIKDNKLFEHYLARMIAWRTRQMLEHKATNRAVRKRARRKTSGRGLDSPFD